MGSMEFDPQTDPGWTHHRLREHARRLIWHYFEAGAGVALCGYWLPWKEALPRRNRAWGQLGNCRRCERALAGRVIRAVEE